MNQLILNVINLHLHTQIPLTAINILSNSGVYDSNIRSLTISLASNFCFKWFFLKFRCVLCFCLFFTFCYFFRWFTSTLIRCSDSAFRLTHLTLFFSTLTLLSRFLWFTTLNRCWCFEMLICLEFLFHFLYFLAHLCQWFKCWGLSCKFSRFCILK